MPTSVILPPGGFSIAHWCLLVAALLPLACAYIAKAPGMKHRPGQRGFDNHNTAHDACKRARECLTAGPSWFLKVLPFVFVLFLPGFVSRMLWSVCEKIVIRKEGRKIKRPSNIEFASGKDYRG